MKYYKKVFQQKEPSYTLINIHKEFVGALVDKAISNAAFDCQRIFALVPIKELCLDQNTSSTNKTYIQVNITVNHVISDHTAFLRNKFNLEVNEENKKFR